ncbi:MAG: class I mannose-6-phosphate isomerase [Cyclobacteriaceae bacterium]|nr:class I mannose-6-phosphate isomerase [Cyclobacteriaceae bacterium]
MENIKDLYPLKFETIFKDKIWGGNKIKSILGKDFGSLPNCGETWELSGVDGNVSVVKEGPLAGISLNELISIYKEKLMGTRVYEKFGNEFPLLIKFIDANEDLSIQVHPDDELAKRRHSSFGKTEMWYIMQADPGAFLYVGFDKSLSHEEYKHHIKENTILDVLHKEKVDAGDVFFIPAGRVHSIGKGILLAEIQQTSDVTYRIYDFERKDNQGNTRQLHTEESVDAIDFRVLPDYKSPYNFNLNTSEKIVESPYFQTNLLEIDAVYELDGHGKEAFTILICMEGEAVLSGESGDYNLKMGDVVLIPACLSHVELSPRNKCKILETKVP